ncbi:Telomerase-binding protein EST1A [Porphyridium purpureum]|uniref:Telomerase-binding protein EST1A n=1 Tax=Porphyridium purpureum TaxID=35688 RepID=A0A5J4Z196_PORPP|nr:Telomerase-binding protein EST1A [Porphyridium purpureum]|eukprot:POR6824..scf208_2
MLALRKAVEVHLRLLKESVKDDSDDAERRLVEHRRKLRDTGEKALSVVIRESAGAEKPGVDTSTDQTRRAGGFGGAGWSAAFRVDTQEQDALLDSQEQKRRDDAQQVARTQVEMNRKAHALKRGSAGVAAAEANRRAKGKGHAHAQDPPRLVVTSGSASTSQASPAPEKDVEQAVGLIWKHTVHEVHEKYRKLLDTHTRSGAALAGHVSELHMEFLQSSLGWFLQLACSLQTLHPQHIMALALARRKLFQCSGDLARYIWVMRRNVAGNGGSQSYGMDHRALASTLYHKALMIAPGHGYPYHLLATLAMTVEQDLLATSYYLFKAARAEVHPTVTAFPHLGALFMNVMEQGNAPSSSLSERDAVIRSVLCRFAWVGYTATKLTPGSESSPSDTVMQKMCAYSSQLNQFIIPSASASARLVDKLLPLVRSKKIGYWIWTQLTSVAAGAVDIALDESRIMSAEEGPLVVLRRFCIETLVDLCEVSLHAISSCIAQIRQHAQESQSSSSDLMPFSAECCDSLCELLSWLVSTSRSGLFRVMCKVAEEAKGITGRNKLLSGRDSSRLGSRLLKAMTGWRSLVFDRYGEFANVFKTVVGQDSHGRREFRVRVQCMEELRFAQEEHFSFTSNLRPNGLVGCGFLPSDVRIIFEHVASGDSICTTSHDLALHICAELSRIRLEASLAERDQRADLLQVAPASLAMNLTPVTSPGSWSLFAKTREATHFLLCNHSLLMSLDDLEALVCPSTKNGEPDVQAAAQGVEWNTDKAIPHDTASTLGKRPPPQTLVSQQLQSRACHGRTELEAHLLSDGVTSDVRTRDALDEQKAEPKPPAIGSPAPSNGSVQPSRAQAESQQSQPPDHVTDAHPLTATSLKEHPPDTEPSGRTAPPEVHDKTRVPESSRPVTEDDALIVIVGKRKREHDDTSAGEDSARADPARRRSAPLVPYPETQPHDDSETQSPSQVQEHSHQDRPYTETRAGASAAKGIG